MSALLDRLIRIRPARPAPAVPPGVYAFEREAHGQVSRLHLRADAGGDGVLIINAAGIARLSAAGVFLTRGLLEGDEPERIVRLARKHFAGATDSTVRDDLTRLQALIDGPARRGSAYPVVNLEDASLAGRSSLLDTPIAADVSFDPGERFEKLLRRLWDEAIPHVVFVLPEQFEHAALRAMVELAEDLGMIAGVRGTATSLAGGTLIEDLAFAGIDHVNLYYLAADATLHDGLLGAGDHAAAGAMFERLHDNEVCPVAEIALLEQTLPGLQATLEQLVTRGVDNAAFFALATDGPADADRHGALSPDDLLQTAATVEEFVESHALSGAWYAPALRDARVSVSEQIRHGPRASGDNAIRVTARGEIFPARGPCASAGNLFEQDWTAIRSGAVYARYVERVTTPTRCHACPALAICAADCPRSRTGWSDDAGGRP